MLQLVWMGWEIVDNATQDDAYQRKRQPCQNRSEYTQRQNDFRPSIIQLSVQCKVGSLKRVQA
jgi:hypothetical protein